MVKYITIGLGFVFLCSEAWAGEASSWRAIYDPIMKWVNFGILAFLLYKYGKGPVKKFIGDQKRAIEEQMSSLESQLKAESLKLEAENRKLEELDSYLEDLKNRILELGRREKEEILNDARRQAQIILQKAEAEANAMVHTAREQIRLELVEKAIAICERELKKALTIREQLSFLDRFIEDLKRYNINSSLA